jgi:hypothetical protein
VVHVFRPGQPAGKLHPSSPGVSEELRKVNAIEANAAAIWNCLIIN